MRSKIWLLVLVFVGGGIGLIYMGAREYFHGRKLAAEGKPTTATVVDKQERAVYKKSTALYVTVAFQTEAGQKIREEMMVTRDIYSSAVRHQPINVIYYPKDPAIFVIGRHPEVSPTKFYAGCVFLPLGLLLFWFMRRNPTAGEIKVMTEDDIVEKVRPEAADKAKEVVDKMAILTVDKYEFETVDGRRFTHLDQQFYDTHQKLLESRGYKFLEDTENVTLRKSANNPNTFTRLLLREDCLVSACLYHFKPKLWQRALGVKELKVLDLDTRFSNGGFLATSNCGAAPQLSQPPEVHSLALPPATTAEQLLTFHEQRIAQFITRTGAQPERQEGLAGVRKLSDDLQILRAEHRRRVGLTTDDWQNISGGKKGDRACDLFYEEVMREHGRTQGGNVTTASR